MSAAGQEHPDRGEIGRTDLESSLRSARSWATLLSVAGLGVATDLISKSLAFARIAPDPVRLQREEVLEAMKHGVVSGVLPAHDSVTVIPSVLDLRLVLNPGAVFGVGPGQRWFFVLFTLAALAFAIWVFANWTTRRSRMAHVALGLIIAGGLGNLYDRLMYGCVRDFLHPLPGVRLPFGLKWPSGSPEVWPWVSNVADAYLLIGIGLLLITLWRAPDTASGAGDRENEKAVS